MSSSRPTSVSRTASCGSTATTPQPCAAKICAIAPPMRPAPITPIQRSAGREAAVDIDHLSGAEIRRRRQQVKGHAHQVLDLAEPAEGDARQRALLGGLAELVVAEHPGGQL